MGCKNLFPGQRLVRRESRFPHVLEQQQWSPIARAPPSSPGCPGLHPSLEYAAVYSRGVLGSVLPPPLPLSPPTLGATRCAWGGVAKLIPGLRAKGDAAIGQSARLAPRLGRCDGTNQPTTNQGFLRFFKVFKVF